MANSISNAASCFGPGAHLAPAAPLANNPSRVRRNGVHSLPAGFSPVHVSAGVNRASARSLANDLNRTRSISLPLALPPGMARNDAAALTGPTRARPELAQGLHTTQPGLPVSSDLAHQFSLIPEALPASRHGAGDEPHSREAWIQKIDGMLRQLEPFTLSDRAVEANRLIKDLHQLAIFLGKNDLQQALTQVTQCAQSGTQLEKSLSDFDILRRSTVQAVNDVIQNLARHIAQHLPSEPTA